MITLATIRDYLRTILPIGQAWFGIGKTDSSKDIALCLYSRPEGASNNIKVGGSECTGYFTEPLKLLIRWGKDSSAADAKAREIFEPLRSSRIIISGRNGFIQTIYAHPSALGTDEKGIYEYCIDFELYYERG